MIRKSILLLIAMVILLSIPGFMSTGVDYTSEAEKLNGYGLFSGSNLGFELDRAPTRMEAAAMLVKLLGKEGEATANHYKHPFTDVPAWADPYIGYMYEKGMTNGVGNNLFGSKTLISAKDFTVFALKALGYTGSDFSYADTMAFAVSKGILTASENTEFGKITFKRDEMVHIAYNALNSKLRNSDQNLLSRLINEGVVTPNIDPKLRLTEQVLSTPSIPEAAIDYLQGYQGYIYVDESNLPNAMKNFTYIITVSSKDLAIYEAKDNKIPEMFYDTREEAYKYGYMTRDMTGGRYLILADVNQKWLGHIFIPQDFQNTGDFYTLEFKGILENQLMQPPISGLEIFVDYNIYVTVNGVEKLANSTVRGGNLETYDGEKKVAIYAGKAIIYSPEGASNIRFEWISNKYTLQGEPYIK